MSDAIGSLAGAAVLIVLILACYTNVFDRKGK